MSAAVNQKSLTVEALWGVLSLKGGLIRSRLCTVKATYADFLQKE